MFAQIVIVCSLDELERLDLALNDLHACMVLKEMKTKEIASNNV